MAKKRKKRRKYCKDWLKTYFKKDNNTKSKQQQQKINKNCQYSSSQVMKGRIYLHLTIFKCRQYDI